MTENQSTVNAWQRETFGPQTDRQAIAEKLWDEMRELHRAVSQSASCKRVTDELADVQIVLWQLAGSYSIDLQCATDAKMMVNRGRSWNVRGDGTAQHVDLAD